MKKITQDLIPKNIISKFIPVFLALFIPIFIKNYYSYHILIMICLYGILILSYNFIAGFTGQFSLAHAAFYGIGAYTSGIMSTRLGIPFWITLPCSGIVSALVSILLSTPTLKLKDVYLTLTTLAFGQVIYIIILNWTSLTGGPYGITDIPAPSIFGYSFQTREYYYLVLFMLCVSYVIFKRVLISKTGRALLAMSEDLKVANSMGINIALYRLFAFSFSAFFAGIAGSLYAHYITFISADSFMLPETIAMLAMMVVGGMNSLPGSIVGPALLIIASEGLRSMYEYRMLIYGVIIIFVILFAPKGLLGGQQLEMRSESIKHINKKVRTTAIFR